MAKSTAINYPSVSSFIFFKKNIRDTQFVLKKRKHIKIAWLIFIATNYSPFNMARAQTIIGSLPTFVQDDWIDSYRCDFKNVVKIIKNCNDHNSNHSLRIIYLQYLASNRNRNWDDATVFPFAWTNVYTFVCYRRTLLGFGAVVRWL